MGIFRHLWQAFKDLVLEVRAFAEDVREARRQFRRNNGLNDIPSTEPPTEILELEPGEAAAELPEAEPAAKADEAKPRRRGK